MEKILITGTGRCGTTFLIKLFSFLGFDTGYSRDNYKNYVFSNCNSGMEKNYDEKPYILKNPYFMTYIENIVKNTSIKIKTVIIPIRDLKESANSRVRNGGQNVAGGLWNAVDEESQIRFYKDILSNYIYISTKYEINTIYIDFDKMTTNKTYLFDKLKSILDEKNVDLETFSKVYDEVSITAKPK
jgi:hypothetical protein